MDQRYLLPIASMALVVSGCSDGGIQGGVAAIDADASEDVRAPRPDVPEPPDQPPDATSAPDGDAMVDVHDVVAFDGDAARDAAPEPADTREAGPPACPDVQPVPVPPELGVDPFYAKYIDAGGVPVVSSTAVPDSALQAAYYTIANMLRDRPCTRRALAESGVRVGILAATEVTTEMPEYADLNDAFPAIDWDERGRGFGATLVRPLSSGAEENLLQYTADEYAGESIFIHEFAHTIFDFGVLAQESGPAIQAELQAAFAAAQAAGLWADTYAATNVAEYFAEGAQSWFDANREADPPNGIHNHVNTREELLAHDSALAAVLKQVFSDVSWAPWCDPTGAGPTWEDPTPADPLAAECALRYHWPALSPCDSLPPASPDSGAPAELVVVNRTYGPAVSSAWLDTSGEPVGAGVAAPRGLWQGATFDGYSWRLLGPDGACLGGAVALPGRTHVVVE